MKKRSWFFRERFYTTKSPFWDYRTGISQRMKNEEERVCLFKFGLPIIRIALSDGFPGH